MSIEDRFPARARIRRFENPTAGGAGIKGIEPTGIRRQGGNTAANIMGPGHLPLRCFAAFGAPSRHERRCLQCLPPGLVVNATLGPGPLPEKPIVDRVFVTTCGPCVLRLGTDAELQPEQRAGSHGQRPNHGIFHPALPVEPSARPEAWLRLCTATGWSRIRKYKAFFSLVPRLSEKIDYGNGGGLEGVSYGVRWHVPQLPRLPFAPVIPYLY